MPKRKLETHKTLDKAERSRIKIGWFPPKWIPFARHFLAMGYRVESTYTKLTKFTYIFITKNNLTIKVRFANSKSTKLQEQIKDYDYCVPTSLSGHSVITDIIPLIEAEYK